MLGDIASVEARAISVPLRQPFRFAAYELTVLPYAWFRIETTSGVVGFGEAPTYWDPTGETQLGAIGIARLWAPDLLGRAADDVAGLVRRVSTLSPGALAARCALEAALLDIRGQVYELPAYRLLGAGSHGRTPRVNAVLGLAQARELDETLELAAGLIARGFSILKIKITAASLGRNAALVTRLRDQHPELVMFVDANQSWNSPKEALRDLEILAAAGIDYVEQPLRANDLRGHAFVRARTPLSVILDESVLTAEDLLRARDAEALDIVNIKLAKAGGPWSAVKMAELARVLGLEVVLGSMVESTLGMLANFHSAMAIEPLFCGVSVYTDVADGLDAGINVADGQFALAEPERHGLGYDRAAVESSFRDIGVDLPDLADGN